MTPERPDKRSPWSGVSTASPGSGFARRLREMAPWGGGLLQDMGGQVYVCSAMQLRPAQSQLGDLAVRLAAPCVDSLDSTDKVGGYFGNIDRLGRESCVPGACAL